MAKKRVSIPQNKIFQENSGTASETTPNGIVMTNSGEYVEPKNKVSTDLQCRALFFTLKEVHDDWVSDMLQIKAQYDGAPPMDPGELAKKKLEYRANFNFGHLQTFIEEYLNSEFTLLDSVTNLVNFTFDVGDREIDRILSAEVSRAWHQTFATSLDFENNLDFMRKDRVLYGFGAFIMNEARSWKFEHVDILNFYAPPMTLADTNRMSTFAIRRVWTVEELWEFFIDESNTFWNKPALGRLLFEHSNAYRKDYSANDLGAWLKRMAETVKSHQYNFDSNTSTLDLISLYVKEYDGKWTHCIFSDEVHTISNKNKGVDVINSPLFFHDRQYDNISDLLHIFPFKRGEKYLFSHSGLGERLEQVSKAMTRMDNQLIDSGLISNTVLISSKNGRNSSTKQIKYDLGGITDIGEAQFEQNLAGANLASSINVNNYIKGTIRANMALDGTALDEPSSRLKSVGELGLQVAEESVVNKPQAKFLYRLLDEFWRALVRKQLYGKSDKMIEEWRSRIKERLAKRFGRNAELAESLEEMIFNKEVPKDRYGLPTFLSVSSSQAASSGSKAADIVATQRMFQLASFMHEEARWKFLRRATAAYDDLTSVDEYFPEEHKPNTTTNGMQEALKENTLLKMGAEFPAVEADAHRDHAPVHLAEIEQLLQSWIEGQIDVVACDDAIRVLLPHFETHMVFLSQNPLDKSVFESLQPRRGQALNLARKVQFDAASAREARMREEQERQEQIAFEQSRLNPNSPEMIKIQADNALKEKEAELKHIRELRANDNNAIIQAAKAERNAKLSEQNAIRKAAAERIQLKAKLSSIIGGKASDDNKQV